MTVNHVPNNYDPVTLNHWLWYQYICSNCSPNEFQSLFEKIMQRIDPKFIKIKPWGQLGDRKTDGLFVLEDGDVEVFQVYAPENMSLYNTKKKINEDLDGAYDFWQAKLKSWDFVYRVNRGIAADVLDLLSEKKKEYDSVEINPLDSDELWEMTRGLSLQKRCEILGAPTGYEHLFFNTQFAPEDLKEMLGKSRFVLVQDVMSPIDLQNITTALDPEIPFGAPFYIRPDMDEMDWSMAVEYQKSMVKEIREKTWDLSPRYAVFSIAPIPLVIHLGFLLTDQVNINYFQYDRIGQTWRWSDTELSKTDLKFSSSGIPEEAILDEVEVAICVSLSAKITDEQVADYLDNVAVKIELSTVSEPSRLWLKQPQQLLEFKKEFFKVLENTLSKVKNCTKIHLFYAGPTGGAIIMGQLVNPRMCPPVVTYEFSFQKSPQYTPAITLSDRTSTPLP